MSAKVRFITLGCRVNQYETQAMREALERGGAVAGRTAVDFVVINTCTVTEEADRTNRYWIRRARREHPAAKIVVTGCGVERDRAQIEALPEVDLVLTHREKAGIASRLLPGCAAPAPPLSISRSEGHTRAFVKIQDGCNHACSFCKVVLVRGRSRSRPLGGIVEEVIRLRDSGYRDIVFAGIQLGAYGLEGTEQIRLEDVLRACAKIEGIDRLRLSSIEPTDVTPALIAALGDIPKCCPHLHIPLQSGDDEILRRMNRRYGRAFYLDLAARLKSELSGFHLTLDVMAGFPGEEERHFQNTLEVLEAVKPLKCHVFPYSRREGTRAARFENIPDETVRARVEQLIRHAERLGREVRLPYLGKTLPVLAEIGKSRPGWLAGLTSNFMKVSFPGKPEWRNRMIPVELAAVEGDTFLGKPLTLPSPLRGEGKGEGRNCEEN